MKLRAVSVLFFVMSLLFAMQVMGAQVEPASLSYQGILTDNAGQILSGQKTITISLYDTPTGGTPFWSDTYTVTLKNGQFSVVLGREDNPLSGKLTNFNGTTYIGLKVGSDPEMPLRQKMTSVAYAFNGVPKGLIAMWSGSVTDVPVGWALCDGVERTLPDGTKIIPPDLRDRFVVGAGKTYAKGVIGGSTVSTTSALGPHNHTGSIVGSTTLTVAQIPSHTHTVNLQQLNSNSESGWGKLTTGNDKVEGTIPDIQTYATGGGQGHSHTITINSEGGHTHTVDILPPYYALAYIVKL